jgi:hypothetical protein
VRAAEQFRYLPGCCLRSATTRSLTYSAAVEAAVATLGEVKNVLSDAHARDVSSRRIRHDEAAMWPWFASRSCARQVKSPSQNAANSVTLFSLPSLSCAPAAVLLPPTCDLVSNLHPQHKLVRVRLCKPHRQSTKAAADISKVNQRRRAPLGGSSSVQLREMRCPACQMSGGCQWTASNNEPAAGQPAKLCQAVSHRTSRKSQG